jgi:hypothetical protein
MAAEWDCIFRKVGAGRDDRVKPGYDEVGESVISALGLPTDSQATPRGFGESDKPAGGYDLDTAARDLHGFLAATNLATAGGIDIIAHDVGTWIAHAHAVNYPADVKRLVLTESNTTIGDRVHGGAITAKGLRGDGLRSLPPRGMS